MRQPTPPAWLVATLAVIVLILGFHGWSQKFPLNSWEDGFNNVFRTLQLLTFQFPREMERGLPWSLQIARLALPLLFILATYKAVLSAARSPVHLALLGFWRGHVVVSLGEGRPAAQILAELGKTRQRRVAIARDLPPEELAALEQSGVTVLARDPRAPESWKAARAGHAAMLVVAHGTDVENLNGAIAAAEILRAASTSTALPLVLIEDDALAEQVDAALDTAAGASGMRWRRLSVGAEAARSLFLAPPLATLRAERGRPATLLLLGYGAGGAAVLRAALTLAQDAAEPPRLLLVAPAEELAQANRLLDPIPGWLARVETLEWPENAPLPEAGLLSSLGGATPDLAVVCQEDAPGLATGLALLRLADRRGWARFPIRVHQAEEDRFLATLSAAVLQGSDLGRIRPFGGILPDGAVAAMLAGREDRLPRAVHEHYLELLAQQGGHGGSPQPWDALPENQRHSNRAAADHIAVKLRAIGCRAVAGPGPGAALTAEEVALLARIEHRRWSADRFLKGWRQGAPRDNRARLHPDLVPWDQLDTAARAKDVDAVEQLPRVLALAGQVIRRDEVMELDAAAPFPDTELLAPARARAAPDGQIVLRLRLGASQDAVRGQALATAWAGPYELALPAPLQDMAGEAAALAALAAGAERNLVSS
jgi:hypothetical protein